MEVLIPGEEKAQSRLYNLFAPSVLRKLGLEEPKPTEREMLTQLKYSIINNKDSDSLIDIVKIIEKSKRLELEPRKAVAKLLDEGFLAEAPQLGKFLMVR